MGCVGTVWGVVVDTIAGLGETGYEERGKVNGIEKDGLRGLSGRGWGFVSCDWRSPVRACFGEEGRIYSGAMARGCQ